MAKYEFIDFMANDSIGTALRSFWHTMTSYDRHASHNSPYRTGAHVPLPQNRHSTLTSVATTASDSRVDLNSPLEENGPNNNSSTNIYSPGLRSSMQRKISEDNVNRSEIQMQNFAEGLPPPPPVGHSWKRIDKWAEEHYAELYDNLGVGCTQNDINELEHELDCTLPMEVRESLQRHDGQERGGLPTGIIFGCMLLDCEEIVQEWKNWRRVSQDYLSRPTTVQPMQYPSKAFSGPSSSSVKSEPQQQQPNSTWREDLLAKQDSQPPNAIKRSYTHPAWIPLARDWGGNCIAVDLAPGPAGKWGQVIIMGRDYDCKYVIARSWAAFLANVADDISTPKVYVDEDSGELKLREFKQPGVEPAYLNILRWRVDQKYGRKGPRRRPAPPGAANGELRGGTNGLLAPGRISPYHSPTPELDRGRSPQRLGGKSGQQSPRAGLSSPLARVTEENPLDGAVRGLAPERGTAIGQSPQASRKNSLATDRLLGSVESSSALDSEVAQLPSPIKPEKEGELAAPANNEVSPTADANKENVRPGPYSSEEGTGLGVTDVKVNGITKEDPAGPETPAAKVNNADSETADIEDGMKTVEL